MPGGLLGGQRCALGGLNHPKSALEPCQSGPDITLPPPLRYLRRRRHRRQGRHCHRAHHGRCLRRRCCHRRPLRPPEGRRCEVRIACRYSVRRTLAGACLRACALRSPWHAVRAAPRSRPCLPRPVLIVCVRIHARRFRHWAAARRRRRLLRGPPRGAWRPLRPLHAAACARRRVWRVAPIGGMVGACGVCAGTVGPALIAAWRPLSAALRSSRIGAVPRAEARAEILAVGSPGRLQGGSSRLRVGQAVGWARSGGGRSPAEALCQPRWPSARALGDVVRTPILENIGDCARSDIRYALFW